MFSFMEILSDAAGHGAYPNANMNDILVLAMRWNDMAQSRTHGESIQACQIQCATSIQRE